MEEVEMDSIDQLVDLGGTLIPPIPFMWYRENHTYCPFEYISKVPEEKMMGLFQSPKPLGDCYVMVQENVLEKSNLYACFHSYAYVNHHKSTEDVVHIPRHFNKSYRFSAIAEPINIFPEFGETELKFVPGPSFVEGEYRQGSAFIHDCAFSPPGDFRFRVSEENDVNTILVHAHCPELDIYTTCIFIVVNSLKEESNSNIIKNIVDQVKDYLK